MDMTSSPPPQVLRHISILAVTLYAEYSYHQKSQILLEKDYSLAFSREQRRNAENRSGRESSRLEQESKKDLIMKREFRPAIFLFLILYLIAGSEVLLLRLAQVETNVDLKDLRTKVLEGCLQENKDVGGFRDNSWQQSVA